MRLGLTALAALWESMIVTTLCWFGVNWESNIAHNVVRAMGRNQAEREKGKNTPPGKRKGYLTSFSY